METEKGPVDLFPTEPTDEVLCTEETLNPWVQGLFCMKKGWSNDHPFFMQKMGLEPTRHTAQEPKSCMSANSITSANCSNIQP